MPTFEEIIYDKIVALQAHLANKYPDYSVFIGMKYEGSVEKFPAISIQLSEATENNPVADTWVQNLDIMLVDYLQDAMPKDLLQKGTQLMEELRDYYDPIDGVKWGHIHSITPNYVPDETGYTNWITIRVEVYDAE